MPSPPIMPPDGRSKGDLASQALGAILKARQQPTIQVLNSQATVRDVVGVTQDNFNLKEENSQLRERMLELERVLAEYQRREETRKERMESRLRPRRHRRRPPATDGPDGPTPAPKKRGWW
ncbi:MAG: hypothetical protein IPK16_32265 [Anaerolineales bacterium]|nr:hypothetical protein [Anaerolineales bacterium]